MAAVSVSAQNTRLDDAETTTNWGSIGGGAGGALETDFKYQNANCYARKGASGQRGIFMSDNATHDMSTATGTYQTMMVKYICTTPGLLDLLSVPGQRLELGSGGGVGSVSTDFYYYDVQGSDTYPTDKSWLVIAIDPNVASHRTGTTGSPSLTIIDCLSLRYDQTGVSKSPNQALDAIDIGSGLTLVGGDGGSTEGVFQDFSDHDWGTSSNRFGYVREAEGVFLVFGMLVIGTATATEFTDEGQTIVYPDGLFGAGFSGVTADIQNASSIVDLGNCTFIGKGSATGEDTRPDLIVTGTSGSFTFQGICQNHRNITFTSVCDISSFTIECKLLTQGSADISEGTIVTSSDTSVACLQDPTFGTTTDLHDVTFVQGGLGHAIEIDTATSYDLTNINFSGYGADTTDSAAIDVTASSGTVTLNILGGNTPTYKTAGATVVIVVNPVTTLITVKDINTGVVLQNARVKLIVTDGSNFPYLASVSITSSGTTATVTHTAHGLSTGDWVKIEGVTNGQEYNGSKQITVTGVNAYTYVLDAAQTSPATGTLLSTFMYFNTLTDVNGQVSDTRSITAGQPVEGWVRKSSSSPYYIQQPIDETISSTNGLTLNIQLIRDE